MSDTRNILNQASNIIKSEGQIGKYSVFFIVITIEKLKKKPGLAYFFCKQLSI